MGCPGRAGERVPRSLPTPCPYSFTPTMCFLLWPARAPLSDCFPLQGGVTVTSGQLSLAGFLCDPLLACFSGLSESATSTLMGMKQPFPGSKDPRSLSRIISRHVLNPASCQAFEVRARTTSLLFYLSCTICREPTVCQALLKPKRVHL